MLDLMNELPVIAGSLRLRTDFWDRHGRKRLEHERSAL